MRTNDSYHVIRSHHLLPPKVTKAPHSPPASSFLSYASFFPPTHRRIRQNWSLFHPIREEGGLALLGERESVGQKEVKLHSLSRDIEDETPFKEKNAWDETVLAVPFCEGALETSCHSNVGNTQFVLLLIHLASFSKKCKGGGEPRYAMFDLPDGIPPSVLDGHTGGFFLTPSHFLLQTSETIIDCFHFTPNSAKSWCWEQGAIAPFLDTSFFEFFPSSKGELASMSSTSSPTSPNHPSSSSSRSHQSLLLVSPLAHSLASHLALPDTNAADFSPWTTLSEAPAEVLMVMSSYPISSEKALTESIPCSSSPFLSFFWAACSRIKRWKRRLLSYFSPNRAIYERVAEVPLSSLSPSHGTVAVAIFQLSPWLAKKNGTMRHQLRMVRLASHVDTSLCSSMVRTLSVEHRWIMIHDSTVSLYPFVAAIPIHSNDFSSFTSSDTTTQNSHKRWIPRSGGWDKNAGGWRVWIQLRGGRKSTLHRDTLTWKDKEVNNAHSWLSAEKWGEIIVSSSLHRDDEAIEKPEMDSSSPIFFRLMIPQISFLSPLVHANSPNDVNLNKDGKNIGIFHERLCCLIQPNLDKNIKERHLNSTPMTKSVLNGWIIQTSFIPSPPFTAMPFEYSKSKEQNEKRHINKPYSCFSHSIPLAWVGGGYTRDGGWIEMSSPTFDESSDFSRTHRLSENSKIFSSAYKTKWQYVCLLSEWQAPTSSHPEAIHLSILYPVSNLSFPSSVQTKAHDFSLPNPLSRFPSLRNALTAKEVKHPSGVYLPSFLMMKLSHHLRGFLNFNGGEGRDNLSLPFTLPKFKKSGNELWDIFRITLFESEDHREWDDWGRLSRETKQKFTDRILPKIMHFWYGLYWLGTPILWEHFIAQHLLWIFLPMPTIEHESEGEGGSSVEMDEEIVMTDSKWLLMVTRCYKYSSTWHFLAPQIFWWYVLTFPTLTTSAAITQFALQMSWKDEKTVFPYIHGGFLLEVWQEFVYSYSINFLKTFINKVSTGIHLTLAETLLQWTIGEEGTNHRKVGTEGEEWHHPPPPSVLSSPSISFSSSDSADIFQTSPQFPTCACLREWWYATPFTPPATDKEPQSVVIRKILESCVYFLATSSRLQAKTENYDDAEGDQPTILSSVGESPKKTFLSSYLSLTSLSWHAIMWGVLKEWNFGLLDEFPWSLLYNSPDGIIQVLKELHHLIPSDFDSHVSYDAFLACSGSHHGNGETVSSLVTTVEFLEKVMGYHKTTNVETKGEVAYDRSFAWGRSYAVYLLRTMHFYRISLHQLSFLQQYWVDPLMVAVHMSQGETYSDAAPKLFEILTTWAREVCWGTRYTSVLEFPLSEPSVFSSEEVIRRGGNVLVYLFSQLPMHENASHSYYSPQMVATMWLVLSYPQTLCSEPFIRLLIQLWERWFIHDIASLSRVSRPPSFIFEIVWKVVWMIVLWQTMITTTPVSSHSLWMSFILQVIDRVLKLWETKMDKKLKEEENSTPKPITPEIFEFSSFSPVAWLLLWRQSFLSLYSTSHYPTLGEAPLLLSWIISSEWCGSHRFGMNFLLSHLPLVPLQLGTVLRQTMCGVVIKRLWREQLISMMTHSRENAVITLPPSSPSSASIFSTDGLCVVIGNGLSPWLEILDGWKEEGKRLKLFSPQCRDAGEWGRYIELLRLGVVGVGWQLGVTWGGAMSGKGRNIADFSSMWHDDEAKRLWAVISQKFFPEVVVLWGKIIHFYQGNQIGLPSALIGLLSPLSVWGAIQLAMDSYISNQVTPHPGSNRLMGRKQSDGRRFSLPIAEADNAHNEYEGVALSIELLEAEEKYQRGLCERTWWMDYQANVINDIWAPYWLPLVLWYHRFAQYLRLFQEWALEYHELTRGYAELVLTLWRHQIQRDIKTQFWTIRKRSCLEWEVMWREEDIVRENIIKLWEIGYHRIAKWVGEQTWLALEESKERKKVTEWQESERRDFPSLYSPPLTRFTAPYFSFPVETAPNITQESPKISTQISVDEEAWQWEFTSSDSESNETKVMLTMQKLVSKEERKDAPLTTSTFVHKETSCLAESSACSVSFFYETQEPRSGLYSKYDSILFQEDVAHFPTVFDKEEYASFSCSSFYKVLPSTVYFQAAILPTMLCTSFHKKSTATHFSIPILDLDEMEKNFATLYYQLLYDESEARSRLIRYYTLVVMPFWFYDSN